MVEGILVLTWNSGLEIWVAIPLCYVTSFIGKLPIEKIAERVRDALGSPPAIFAHSDERGPVPRPEKSIKCQSACLKLAIRGDKPIEIGQLGVKCITDALETVERDFAHFGEPGDGGGFHVDEGGFIG